MVKIWMKGERWKQTKQITEPQNKLTMGSGLSSPGSRYMALRLSRRVDFSITYQPEHVIALRFLRSQGGGASRCLPRSVPGKILR